MCNMITSIASPHIKDEKNKEKRKQEREENVKKKKVHDKKEKMTGRENTNPLFN